MIVAIERSHFNILYKYDQLTVGLKSVIDLEINELEKRVSNQSRFESVVRDLDNILPIFELDHEVLLIELDKSKVSFTREMIIPFNSILMIYPLTTEGSHLLEGKLNDNIKIGEPLFEKAIIRVKGERTIRLRINTAKKLIDIFNLSIATNLKFKESLQSAINSLVFKGINDDSNILSHLLSYDITPNYLPSGNAEYIIKLGVITLMSLKKEESIIKNGFFYKYCVANKDIINEGTIFDGFENFNKLLFNKDLNLSYYTIIESINPKFDGLNIFKIAYYFLAIKSYLNKTEKDLISIAQLLYSEAQKDPTTLIHVLLLVGYSFSYEELYDSIHQLEQAPVLLRTFNLKKINVENQYRILNSLDTSEKILVSKQCEDKKTDLRDEMNLKDKILEIQNNNMFEDIASSKNSTHLEHTNTHKVNDKEAPQKLDVANTGPTSKKTDENGANIAHDMSVVAQGGYLDEYLVSENNTVGSMYIREDKAEANTNDSQKNLDNSNLNSKSEVSSQTVKDFNDWILKNTTGNKQKVWIEFIEINFTDKGAKITSDNISDAFSKSATLENPLFTKSGKPKSETISIVNDFFNIK